MQDSESPQSVPAACPADTGLHLQWNMFGMKEGERPVSINRDVGLKDAMLTVCETKFYKTRLVP